MGTNHLAVGWVTDPKDAPVYRSPEFLKAELFNAMIVRNGTIGGNATIDLVFKGPDGQKYVAMITAKILQDVLKLSNPPPKEEQLG